MAQPVHLMKFAPADYLLDSFVQGCIRRCDWTTLAFYTLFLFKSHYEGGSLPADPVALGDHLNMQPDTASAALETCVAASKLRVEDGRVYHKRVAREVKAAREYIDEQRETGKKGGRPPSPQNPTLSPTLSTPETQPSLAVAEPEPSQKPSPSPSPDVRAGYIQAVRDKFYEIRGAELPEASSADYGWIVSWFEKGYELRTVLAAMSECQAAKKAKPNRVAYFDGPIREAAERAGRARTL